MYEELDSHRHLAVNWKFDIGCYLLLFNMFNCLLAKSNSDFSDRDVWLALAACDIGMGFAGGSHYMLLDEVSHTFHQRGHDVRMLVQMGIPVIQGKTQQHELTLIQGNLRTKCIHEV